jgi:alpha-amylase
MAMSLCLHIHQPVGNFDHVMEGAYDRCYLPLLDALHRHRTVSGLHISGCLLDWIEERHPEFAERLSSYLAETGSEMLTSGYYEPILPILRPDDAEAQIGAFSDRLEALGGGRPRGLWLTERVWEPALPGLLDRCGVQWAVVDDRHLRLAGVDADRCWRPAITEDGGRAVTLLPSGKRLRYLIPFHPVEEVVEELAGMRDRGVELAFYGDDGEKFGVWPGTHDLCYRRGWLDRFLDMLGQTPWIRLVSPSEAARDIRPQGPVYVPTASYREMGEWTLTVPERREQRRLVDSCGEEVEDHLREGFWRSFLTRYPESGELHKLMLHRQPAVRDSGSEEALRSLWRSQCNCPYWHGVFGGIYLPHLREAVWTELLRACRVVGREGGPEQVDFDRDGREEILLDGRAVSAVLRPERGLTCTALAWTGGEVPRPLGHVLSRRVEAYHDLVGDPPEEGEENAKTIHSETEALEPGLAGLITRDRWRRCLFSDLLLPPDASPEDWAGGDGDIACFQDAQTEWSWSADDAVVSVRAEMRLGEATVTKSLTVDPDAGKAELDSRLRGGRPGWLFGVELCLNMLTGSAEDRFLSLDGGRRRPLGESGQATASSALVADLWRDVSLRVDLDRPAELRFAPLYSVSRSERGYERVFQGSALMPVGRVDGDGRCSLSLRLRVGDAGG